MAEATVEAPETEAAEETQTPQATSDAEKADKMFPSEDKAEKSEESKEEKTEEPSDEKDESLLGKESTEVPEEYEFQVEGMELDKKMVERFTPLFKDMKLTQPQAQKLVDLYADQIRAQGEEYQQTIEGWKNDTIKSLGKDYQSQLSVANKFIDRFGNDKVRSVLNDTGLGNHPEVVSMFINAGKHFSDDKFVAGDNTKTVSDPEMLARKMFPNTNYK